MSRVTIIVAAALVFLAVSGCGSSGGSASYVGAFGNELDYIHWKQSSSGQLQGAVTADHLSGRAPELTLLVNTTRFTGRVNGSSVNLTFRRLFDLNAHLAGWISGSTLTLNIGQSNGLVLSAHFSAEGRDAFNRAIARLRGQIQRTNTRAAQAKAKHGGDGVKASAISNRLYRLPR